MLEMSFEYPDIDEMLPLLVIADADQWIGSDKSRSKAEVRIEYRRWFQQREDKGLPCTILRLDGKVIGYGMSTRCEGNRAKLCKLKEPNDYWKIGLFFVLPEHRGKGYGLEAARWFLAKKKKMAYFVEEGNERSKAIPIALGLKYMHDFYDYDGHVSFMRLRKPGPFRKYHVYMN